jgi:carbon-monoxide dehydrogenase medium subunit
VDEVLNLLAEHGEEASVLAGGQSLVPLMNLRFARPEFLIDLNRVPGLGEVSMDAQGLEVGAMARHAEIASSRRIRGSAPLLSDAASLVGHPAVRNRGTLGGGLAEADPAGHLPPVALALGAEVHVASQRGVRWIEAGDLFLGLLMTSLEPDELIVSVRFSPSPAFTGAAFEQVVRRHGDFPLASAACVISVDENARVTAANLVLGGVAATPARVASAEAALIGRRVDQVAVDEVAQEVVKAVDPVDNTHATAAYRRRAAAALAARAVQVATERALQEQTRP